MGDKKTHLLYLLDYDYVTVGTTKVLSLLILS